MSTALTNTGVQFPDNTIQTSAAAAGATGPAGADGVLSAPSGSVSTVSFSHPNPRYAPAGSGWYLVQAGDHVSAGTPALYIDTMRLIKGRPTVIYWDTSGYYLKGRSWSNSTVWYWKL